MEWLFLATLLLSTQRGGLLKKTVEMNDSHTQIHSCISLADQGILIEPYTPDIVKKFKSFSLVT